MFWASSVADNWRGPFVADKETALEESIVENAKGEKTITIDGETVTQHSIKDQIEAAKFQSANKATSAKGIGFSAKKLKPPGTA